MVRQALALILLCSALGAAQEFYVTYKLHSKNLQFYNETIYIAKAMTEDTQEVYKVLTFATDLDSLSQVLHLQKHRIIDTLLTHTASVDATTHTQNFQTAAATTTLRIYPRRIKVAFNNGLVKIGLLK